MTTLFPGLFLWVRFPAFISWCAISAGIFITSQYATQITNSPYSLLYNNNITAATFSFLVGVLSKNQSIRFFCFFISGALLYLLYTSNKETLFINLKNNAGKNIVLYGRVSSPSLPYPDNVRYLFSIDSTSKGAEFLCNKTVQCLGVERVTQGKTLSITGKIKLPSRRKNLYEYDDFSYLLSNGITTKFIVDSLSSRIESIPILDKFSNQFRSCVASVINKFTNPDHRAIFYAAFLGESEYLSSALKLSFRNAGVYHLLSISGLHAAMIIGACYFLLSFIPIPQIYRHCIALVVIWSYQCFIGFIPCLFRATLMATLIIITFLFQKKSYPVQAIGLAGSIWLLLSPESLFQPGFQLSFAATFGILVIYPVLNRFQPAIQNRFAQYLVSTIYSSLLLSLTGLICTLPIIMYYFGSISIFGLFANLVAVPAMTLAMWCFFVTVVSAVFFPLLIPVPICLCKFALDILLATANVSSLFNWSSIKANAMSTGVVITFSAVIISIAVINKRHQKTAILMAIPALLFFTATDILIHRLNSSVSITGFNIQRAKMYAVTWTSGKVWLFINSSRQQTTNQCLKIVETWIHHRGYCSIEKIFLHKENKNSSGTIAGYQNIFTETIVGKDDSLYFIINSRSLLKKCSDTCVLAKRNDTLWAKIIRTDLTVQFPISGTDPGISLHIVSSERTDYEASPCVVTLKKRRFIIHHYKFSGI